MTLRVLTVRNNVLVVIIMALPSVHMTSELVRCAQDVLARTVQPSKMTVLDTTLYYNFYRVGTQISQYNLDRQGTIFKFHTPHALP